jgi:hypothetical protein
MTTKSGLARRARRRSGAVMGRTLYLQVLMDDGRIVDAPPPLGKRMRAVSGVAREQPPLKALLCPQRRLWQFGDG